MLTIILWIPACTRDPRITEYTNGFYLLRMVGSLQYLRWIKDLHLIMQALSMSVFGLFLLMVLVLLAFLYFAMAGILLFKDSDPYHFSTPQSRYRICP